MPVQATHPSRIDAIDTLRGLALVWMTAYHFCFDLNNLGWARLDFYRDPVWTLQRTVILSLFLFCAGLGQAVAVQQQLSWPRFWRRWLQIAGCALLVSAGSWWMFPNSYIYFGVLHGLALMLVVARLTAAWARWLALLALWALATPFVAAAMLDGSPWADPLNAPALNWLGLITRKPVTEDYVPLLPWLGVLWLGVWAGSALLRLAPALRDWQADGVWAVLALLGRRSLLYYMLHQPVMIGSLWLLKTLAA